MTLSPHGKPFIKEKINDTEIDGNTNSFEKTPKDPTPKFDFSITRPTIPKSPGIYIMKNINGHIIYIGKAKNLKKRVESYFLNTRKHDWKTAKLVEKVKNIEFIVTDNEIEAFLLESNLIKKYKPLYNIELKDQQRYTYLKITHEKFPRLLVARRNRQGDFSNPYGDVYGPFVKGSSKYLTIGFLRKLFKIRICNSLPKKTCLEYHIGNCEGPCIKNVSEERYGQNISLLKSILEGRNNSVQDFISKLYSDMKKVSDEQKYEQAIDIRETIERFENLITDQKMDKIRKNHEDYVGIKKDYVNGLAYVMILNRTHGVISDGKKFEFELIGDNNFASFLFHYYSSVDNSKIPNTIYTNEDPESMEILEKSLERICKHKVIIKTVDKNFKDIEKTDLINLLERNLQIYFENKYEPGLLELKNNLNLRDIPLIIDCFDISNYGTTFAVGACTRFYNGKPYKKGYRRFKIKSIIKKQDDFAMINEIVYRRYHRMQNEVEITKNNYLQQSNDVSPDILDTLPNLIVVDGGKGQLSSANDALKRLGLKIPAIGLAKENEELFMIDIEEGLILPRNNSGLKILQHIRDEAHRFGLAYNIKLRKIDTT
ncbi:MAG: excinuclease ABC subunit C [Nitrososphaeraceae archaeon]|nr:excinuclease ABC subunit C [Nitrososphaeraceae archaeon]